MLDSVRVSVLFYCPSCGSGLRAPRADAGSPIECHLCGEAVRVPHKPHPLESETADVPLIQPAAAATALIGCRLLTASLSIFLFEFSVVLLILLGCVVFGNYQYFLTADIGSLRDELLALMAFHGSLMVVRSSLRWLGYLRCNPAAISIRASGWNFSARYGAITMPIGYSLVLLSFWLEQAPLGSPPLLQALTDIGLLIWACGTVMEFGAVVVWQRVLTELDWPAGSHRIVRYTLSTALTLISLSLALCFTVIVTILALRRNGTTSHQGSTTSITMESLPSEAWYASTGLFVLVTLFVILLSWQYLRILISAKAGFTALRG